MGNLSKFIVVIGATGGIGTSITEEAVRAGFTVIATGREKGELSKINKKFKENQVITFELDLEKPDTFQNFISFVKKNTQSIHWLINSAGHINHNEPSLTLTSAEIQKTFTINVEAVIDLSYKILPIIESVGGIINISSTAGIWGNPQFPIYSASKAALNIFSKSLAKTQKLSGLAILTICPGPTNTPMRERIAHDASKQQDPRVVAETVLMMLNKKNKYKNGDIFVVKDGIETLRSGIDN